MYKNPIFDSESISWFWFHKNIKNCNNLAKDWKFRSYRARRSPASLARNTVNTMLTAFIIQLAPGFTSLENRAGEISMLNDIFF